MHAGQGTTVSDLYNDPTAPPYPADVLRDTTFEQSPDGTAADESPLHDAELVYPQGAARPLPPTAPRPRTGSRLPDAPWQGQNETQGQQAWRGQNDPGQSQGQQPWHGQGQTQATPWQGQNEPGQSQGQQPWHGQNLPDAPEPAWQQGQTWQGQPGMPGQQWQGQPSSAVRPGSTDRHTRGWRGVRGKWLVVLAVVAGVVMALVEARILG